MERTVRKALKTGYGLGLLTLEQARKVVSRVKKDLNMDDAESRKLAEELVASSKKASQEVLQTVGKNFEAAVVKTGLIKKGELSQAAATMKERLRQKWKKAGTKKGKRKK